MNKRKFTPRIARLDHIRSFLSSGKSKKIWCQENEIALSTFSKWMKEYREAQDEVKFVPLKPSAAYSDSQNPIHDCLQSKDEILVELGSCRIHVPAQIGTSFLVQEIKAASHGQKSQIPNPQ